MNQHIGKHSIVLLTLLLYGCESAPSKEDFSTDIIKAEINQNSPLNPEDPAYQEKKAGQQLFQSMPQEWIAIEYDSLGKPYLMEPCMGESPEIKFYKKDGLVYMNFFTGDEEEEYSLADFKNLPEEANQSVAELNMQYLAGGGYKTVKVMYDPEFSSWTGLKANSVLRFSERNAAQKYPLIEEFCEE